MIQIQKSSTSRGAHAPKGSTSGRPISRRLTAIGLAALLGIAACGSDEDSSSTDQQATTDEQSASTDSGDVDETVADDNVSELSLPEGVTLPPGESIPQLSDECLGYAQMFASIFTGDADALGDVDDALDALESKVPGELQEDFRKVAAVFAEVSKKYADNPTAALSDPDLLPLFSDPEFAAASEEINEWLSTECGVES